MVAYAMEVKRDTPRYRKEWTQQGQSIIGAGRSVTECNSKRVELEYRQFRLDLAKSVIDRDRLQGMEKVTGSSRLAYAPLSNGILLAVWPCRWILNRLVHIGLKRRSTPYSRKCKRLQLRYSGLKCCTACWPELA